MIQLKIEREALKKETDTASKDRLEKLEAELSELEQKSAEMTARWQAEKDKLADANTLKEQLDEARTQLEQHSGKVTSPRPGSLPMARSRTLRRS